MITEYILMSSIGCFLGGVVMVMYFKHTANVLWRLYAHRFTNGALIFSNLMILILTDSIFFKILIGLFICTNVVIDMILVEVIRDLKQKSSEKNG